MHLTLVRTLLPAAGPSSQPLKRLWTFPAARGPAPCIGEPAQRVLTRPRGAGGPLAAGPLAPPPLTTATATATTATACERACHCVRLQDAHTAASPGPTPLACPFPPLTALLKQEEVGHGMGPGPAILPVKHLHMQTMEFFAPIDQLNARLPK
jgi:hypothetical protein